MKKEMKKVRIASAITVLVIALAILAGTKITEKRKQNVEIIEVQTEEAYEIKIGFAE